MKTLVLFSFLFFFSVMLFAQQNPKSSVENSTIEKNDSVQVVQEKSERTAIQGGGVRIKAEPEHQQYDTIRTERMIIVRPKENPAIQKESPK